MSIIVSLGNTLAFFWCCYYYQYHYYHFPFHLLIVVVLLAIIVIIIITITMIDGKPIVAILGLFHSYCFFTTIYY